MSKKYNGYRIRQGFIPYVEGVAEISGGLTIDGNDTYSQNILKKQGKYVIFNLDTGLSGYWSGDATITVPKEFAPKYGATFYMAYNQLTTVEYKALLTSINSEGKIHLSYPDGGAWGVKILNIGWETE